MLLRIIAVISLIQFLLLMVSGKSMNIALYRGLVVFLILFSLIYISIFLLNIVQNNTNAMSKGSAAAEGSDKSQNESGK
ncbi:hypothetical protein [Fodinibius salsisoli]|uniref:hypothetical protein n=1 Tax=Fodinibius salsisoli TaxID=2820877 RepID=UPI0022457454|nr:hypothetical protein [Fodinibius salsisoli]